MRQLGRMDHDECAPWCDHDPAHHHPFCFASFCGGKGDCEYRRLDNEELLYKPGDGDCFWLAEYGHQVLVRAINYLKEYNRDLSAVRVLTQKAINLYAVNKKRSGTQ